MLQGHLPQNVQRERLSPPISPKTGSSSYLWLGSETSPDIVVRTGAESRVSNFLLWEMAYAELFFLDALWPDFTPATLEMIVQKFKSRNRRFGG